MNKVLQDSLNGVLYNWRNIQMSDIETADMDVTQFGAAFDLFVEDVLNWVETLDTKVDIDYLRNLPELQEIKKQLPEPLFVHFEFELESFLNGSEMTHPASYFG